MFLLPNCSYNFYTFNCLKPETKGVYTQIIKDMKHQFSKETFINDLIRYASECSFYNLTDVNFVEELERIALIKECYWFFYEPDKSHHDYACFNINHLSKITRIPVTVQNNGCNVITLTPSRFLNII